MNKNFILIGSFLGSIIAFISWYYVKVDYNVCYNTFLFPYENICSVSLFIFGILVSILVSSLIIYFLRESIFNTWKKFTFIYLFLYLFILFIAPFTCDSYFPICKQTVFLFLIPLYFITSIILILYKSFKR